MSSNNLKISVTFINVTYTNSWMRHPDFSPFTLIDENKEDFLKDKERAKIKVAARELLERLKENEFKVNHWTEKVQTTAAVRKVIEDHLFLKLPYPTYDEDVSLKADILFNDFKERYANFAA